MSCLSRRLATLGLAVVVAVAVFGVVAPGAWAWTVRADNNTQVTIPDPGTVDSTVSVTGVTGAIQKVTVSLWMWGGRDSDDSVYLVAPDGTQVELTSNNGGLGNEYGTGSTDESRTTFDDSAATSITAGVAPFAGTFKPEGSLTTLVGKSGSQVNGTWTLRVTDSVHFWQGALHCWSLVIDAGPGVRFNNNTQVVIPDPGSADSTISVSGITGPIRKVTVSLWMWGGADYQDTIYLVAPDGTEVKLSSKNGGLGNEYGSGSADASRTIFDDSATTPIAGGAAPFLGTFWPEQPLSALVGKSDAQVNGTWTLRVVDDEAAWTGALHCWSLTIETAPTRVDFTTDTPIPDVTTVDIPLQVSGLTRPIQKVRLSLFLSHTYDHDLVLTLIGPDGASAVLASHRGGASDDYGVATVPDASRTMFDDAAGTPIGSGSAPFVGEFIPETPLSVFNGKTGAQANGTWILRIADVVGGDSGTLHACSLSIYQDYGWDGPPLPVTTLSAAPAAPDGLNGWYVSAPTITLWRDVAGTSYYHWQDAATLTTYTSPFSAIEGSHTLVYFSADSLNNTEAPRPPATFRLDTVDATITALNSSTHPSQYLVYPSHDATFTWTASDAGGSGVDGYSYSLDQTATTVPDTVSEGTTASTSYKAVPEGDSYFHLRVRDAAGHWSATRHRRIRVALPEHVIRISGADRYGTAVAAASDVYPGWTGVKHVVIASGEDAHQPDALTAAGLAGAYDAPLLLVPTNYLHADVHAAIVAMPKGVRVHIVGGTAAVSAKVANLLKGISKVASVDRLSGVDRYSTAAAVANRMKSVLGSHLPRIALITNGQTQSLLLDPLIASTASARMHIPVLLLRSSTVPAITRTTLSSLGLSTRYIVGSQAAVPESSRVNLGVPAGNRIAGVDVQCDATAFATRAGQLGWLSNAVLGFAAKVPDAATGGAYMGKRNGALLLVNPSSVPTTTCDHLTANFASISAGYLFGGPTSVTETVRLNLQSLIN